jgi:hypothetical protein
LGKFALLLIAAWIGISDEAGASAQTPQGIDCATSSFGNASIFIGQQNCYPTQGTPPPMTTLSDNAKLSYWDQISGGQWVLYAQDYKFC